MRDTIRVLNEAVLERRTVAIEYRTGRTGRESQRELDPYRIWYRAGALFVVGHDHDSGEVRTFAVQRIRSIAHHAARFRCPPASTSTPTWAAPSA